MDLSCPVEQGSKRIHDTLEARGPSFKPHAILHPHYAGDGKGHGSWPEGLASPPYLPHPGGLPPLILDSHVYMAILGARAGARGAATDLCEAVSSREKVRTWILHLSGICSQFCHLKISDYKIRVFFTFQALC